MLSPDTERGSTWEQTAEALPYYAPQEERLPDLAGVEPWHSLSGMAGIEAWQRSQETAYQRSARKRREDQPSDAAMNELRLRLTKLGITQREFARRVGKQRSWLNDRLRKQRRWAPGEWDMVQEYISSEEG